jgi:lysyl-tRNA synthetase class 2
MKRLLAAGYERIFQICHCWRQGERGRLHLPEFTMLEWYHANTDYRSLMEECEALIRFVAASLHCGEMILYRDKEISLAGSWERITVADAFRRFTPFSMTEALQRDLFDELMVQNIEPRLGIAGPTFIYDYPAPRAALARLSSRDPDLAERFELYIGGVELANAFSELIDPEEQCARFQLEQDYRLAHGLNVYPLPEKFLGEMHRMPPAAGIALGLDRLIMILLNATSVDEVVAFTPEEL